MAAPLSGPSLTFDTICIEKQEVNLHVTLALLPLTLKCLLLVACNVCNEIYI